MTAEIHDSSAERVPPPAARETETAPAGSRALPGLLAVVAAALFAVMHGAAVAAASAGDFATATVLAWTVIVGTIATLLLGAASVVLGRGRRWGVLAIALSVVANPLVLTRVLGFFGG